MQTYQDIASTLKVKDSRALLLERDEALRSGFAGATAPSTPAMVAGQRWFNTVTLNDGVYDGAAVRELLQARHGLRVVDTLADLKALAGGSAPAVFIHGRGASGDGAHGVFRWAAASTATADDALVVMPTAGGTGRWLRDVDLLFNVLWWGAKRDLSADALGAATAALTAAIGAGRGGGVVFPAGFYAISDTLPVTGPVEIIGAGGGLDTGSGYSGGTVLRFGHASNDLIAIASRGAVIVRDMTIDTSVTRTAGATIDLQGDVTAPTNRGSRFDRLRMIGAWNGLRVRAAADWSLRDSRIHDFRSHGAYLSGEGFTGSTGDEEVGHSSIEGCTIWDQNIGTSAACVRYNRGGDVRLRGNKLLRGNYGVLVSKTAGITGTLIIEGNSIEQQFVQPVRVEQTTSGGEFGNLVVNDNQISIIEGSEIPGADPQGAVAIIAGTPSISTCWVKNVTIQGNVINDVVTPSSSRAVFAIDDGDGVSVSGNVVHLNGSADANNYLIGVGANARNVSIGVNTCIGLTSTAKRYLALTAHCRVVDPTPIPFASAPAVADGSMMYYSDGLAGSSPLAGSGSGAMAFRQNGAWQAYSSGGLNKSGDTMTGTLEITPGTNEALRLKDSGGVVRSYIGHSGLVGGVTAAALRIRCEGHDIALSISGTLCAVISGSGGHFLPGADGSFDFGSASLRWRAVNTNKLSLKPYTVAAAPAGAAGDLAYFSNARKNGEGAGAGTGFIGIYDTTGWKVADTGAAIAA